MLQIKDLSFTYQKKEVLSKINFSINRGDFVGLLGANGSGKTTLLKCLNGILSPSRGRVLLHEVELNHVARREIARLLAFVPQEHGSIFAFLALDVILMGITPHLPFGRMPSEEDYERAESIMEMMGIKHLKKRSYNQLSGGERQLLLVGRALMQGTEYLLLDEPTAHLDFKNQHILMKEIKRMTQREKGVLMALHDPNLALKYCNQAILLKGGEILAEGETREAITTSNLKDLYDLDVVIETLSRDRAIVIPQT